MGLPKPPLSVCQDQSMHKNFECLGRGKCFTLFSANPKPSQDFGQPKAYSVITQDLRKMEGGGRGPWEVNDPGKIKIDLGGDVGSREVQISDNRQGMAMSKALVYYHWPDPGTGGWKEHPNFFNPYWKAKLQPFRQEEAVEILETAGALDYVDIAKAGAPLP